jgi:plasmid maintenance system antidote protein VapI
MIDRYKTTRAIKDLEIPKSDLAALADVLPCRVSDYISGKRVPSAIAARIEEAVANVVKVWSTLPVRVDISDQRGFAKAVEIVDAAIAKVNAEDAVQESARPDLESLRLRPA